MGGITSAIGGGSFLDGFADGALTGAITGAITGAACAGLSVAGAALGKGIQCLSTLGKVINVTSKVTKVISLGMDGFDVLALGIGFFDPDNQLVKLNQELHSSALYNGFQIGVNALAILTAGATSTMPCFVAGTMILTAAGLVAIENIKAGDKVISMNAGTRENGEKPVLWTYINESNELAHVFVNGEEIIATQRHLFYEVGKGWVAASSLGHGSILMLPDASRVEVERVTLETLKEPVKVYNFEVADWHTYHVGNICILVHNDCDYSNVKNPQNAGEGKEFTRRQKREFYQENAKQNGGKILDDVTGEECVLPQQSKRGVKPPDNEATIDHVKPKSRGGTNTNDNAHVRTRKSNIEKSDIWP